MTRFETIDIAFMQINNLMHQLTLVRDGPSGRTFLVDHILNTSLRLELLVAEVSCDTKTCLAAMNGYNSTYVNSTQIIVDS